jgi:hypothetical protein
LFNTLILFPDYNNEEYFTNPEIDESFWDPVIVSLPDELINSDIITIELQECTICNNNNTYFKKLSCCNNLICVECNITWFNLSVYCPYCKHDLRI